MRNSTFVYSRIAALISLGTLLPSYGTAAPLPPPSRPLPLDCTGKDGVSAREIRNSQVAWAAYLRRPVEEEDEITGGVKMAFVLIPPGKFLMGSPETESGRCRGETLHEVTITKPFYLAKYPVTQQQYEALTGTRPSRFNGASLPVEQVNWAEAVAYTKTWMGTRQAGLIYRLPTEAQWEYACRAGRPAQQAFGVGDGISLSSDQANVAGDRPYGRAPKGIGREKTTPPGSFPANALGLYDMQGNVSQWCYDWYGPYASEKQIDPTGATSSSWRVIRGGFWHSPPEECRAAMRMCAGPAGACDCIGFRVARILPEPEKTKGPKPTHRFSLDEIMPNRVESPAAPWRLRAVGPGIVRTLTMDLAAT